MEGVKSCLGEREVSHIGGHVSVHLHDYPFLWGGFDSTSLKSTHEFLNRILTYLSGLSILLQEVTPSSNQRLAILLKHIGAEFFISQWS